MTVYFVLLCFQEYYQLMLEYLNENVPVEGLGVQGHFQEYLAVDPTLILVLLQSR